MLSDLDSNNDSSNFINNNAHEKLLGKKRKNGKEKHKICKCIYMISSSSNVTNAKCIHGKWFKYFI